MSLALRDRAADQGERCQRLAALRRSGQTTSFSIHQVAERQHAPFNEIERRYDRLERQMLDEFYAPVGAHGGMNYLHWNMRDIDAGFLP